ncbi:MAG: hypothetical protein IT365_14845 [Candidatus Hydrogenedentes bacterium]|nr:hypothetical protein [Candidatus Hydrogenedentota bacterium]
MRRVTLFTLLLCAVLNARCIPSSYQLYEFLELMPESSGVTSDDSQAMVLKRRDYALAFVLPDDDLLFYCPAEYRTVQVDNNGLIVTPYLANRVGARPGISVYINFRNESEHTHTISKDSFALFRHEKDFRRSLKFTNHETAGESGASLAQSVSVERNRVSTAGDTYSLAPGESALLVIHFDLKYVGDGILQFSTLQKTSQINTTYVLKMVDSGRRSVHSK